MTSVGIREITYRYGDAPVPPEHHRSYEVRVTPHSVHVTVDSYGEILAMDTLPVAEGVFREIVAALGRFGIRGGDLGDDEGCTGGTSESISWVDGNGPPFAATVYHCGGRDTGNLAGDVAGFAGELRRLVPGLGRIV